MIQIKFDVLSQAAKKVRDFKRSLFDMETSARRPDPNSKSEVLGLPYQKAVEIVTIQKHLLPEDHDYKMFNAIVQCKSGQEDQFHIMNQSQLVNKKDPIGILQRKLAVLFEKSTLIIELWQESNWKHLQLIVENIEINDILTHRKHLQGLLPQETQNKQQAFECILGLIFAELDKSFKYLLCSDELSIHDPSYQLYMAGLNKVKKLIEQLYFEFVTYLQASEGEQASLYKLFMHVLYEIESTIYFIKDLFLSKANEVSMHLKQQATKADRKFERIYQFFEEQKPFQTLIGWLETRVKQMEVSKQYLIFVYQIRRALFSILDRKDELAFCFMQLWKIYLNDFKSSGKNLGQVIKYRSLCIEKQDIIVDFELQNTKHLLKMEDASRALVYLQTHMKKVEQKAKKMSDQLGTATPQLVYQKSQLLELDLMIQIDPINPKNYDHFEAFTKKIKELKWEKPHILFAQYIERILEGEHLQPGAQTMDVGLRKKRQIKCLYSYMKAAELGHKYIWRSLPRALELWFERKVSEGNINAFMRSTLYQLEPFKIATVHQMLISRFGHPLPEVRETIVFILSKLALQYPEQSAWWICHLQHFKEQQQDLLNNNQMTRALFANRILEKIRDNQDQPQSKFALATIKQSQVLFGELIQLCETKAGVHESEMQLSRVLMSINKNMNLVIPTEENLTPQLADLKFKFQNLRSLAQTTLPLEQSNQSNLEVCDMDRQILPEIVYPVYKLNPVRIQCFQSKVKIYPSKERPKQIAITGTDGKTYYFLLKLEGQGDLRKEQRFVGFAVFCNKMLQHDPEARSRGLCLRTYAIVPLSQETGLIEWIQNTSTLRHIIEDQQKALNIKGDYTTIDNVARIPGLGWGKVKASFKPVLGHWFAEHYPSPDLWYEARLNFVRTTAIWSVFGYFIGLGDRHGDNILVHQLTGEVTHVDFDCLFGKSAKLQVPEVVPFRLTQNIIDSFGILKEKGVFQKSSEVVLRVMQENKTTIMSFFANFRHDPVRQDPFNWQFNFNIDEALFTLDQRLSGIVDRASGRFLTVKEQVNQLISDATSDQNLSRMFIGWEPWQ